MTCLRWHRWKVELQLQRFWNLGARREWVVSTTSRSRYPRGKPVPVVQGTTHTASTRTKVHEWTRCWTSSHNLLFSSPVAVRSSVKLSFEQHLNCSHIASASVWSMFLSTQFSYPWPRFLSFFFFFLFLLALLWLRRSSLVPPSPLPPVAHGSYFFDCRPHFFFICDENGILGRIPGNRKLRRVVWTDSNKCSWLSVGNVVFLRSVLSLSVRCK